MNNDNDVKELLAPPFNKNTPTGAQRDSVRKLIDATEGNLELSRCQFAANLFQQFETVGGNLARFTGKTVPPAEEFMLGWQQAFQIASFVMTRMAGDKPTYVTNERMGDIAGIITPVIEALFDAKLMTSIHLRGAPPLEDIMSSDTAA